MLEDFFGYLETGVVHFKSKLLGIGKMFFILNYI